MALAIDASTPAYVENEAGAASLTTAAFTPPVGSILVMAAIFDTGTNTRTITPSTATGSTTAWTTVEHFVGTNGLVGIFWARVLSAVSTTVTATFAVSNDCAMKTWVFTGADTVAPVGAHGNVSIATNPQTVSYTATRVGSLAVLCEESFNGVAVTISNTTLEGALTTNSAGMIVRQTAASAGLTTQSFDVAGTTNSPALAYAEIRPATATGVVSLNLLINQSVNRAAHY